jgi:hypothetical protein
VLELIVFETLAALTYAFLWMGQWPALLTPSGSALLVAGVLRALRIEPVRAGRWCRARRASTSALQR